jgi:hypothetical protein
MNETVRAARVAGLLYVIVGALGAFTLIYVPQTLIEPGNAAATASKILASETLFRLGIVSGLLSSVVFIFLARALYRLFVGVNKAYASLMVVLVSISVAVGFMSTVNSIAALELFRGADYLSVFDKPQRDALGLLFLRLNGRGNVVNEIFWGLWLFPFGALVMRSRFLPRVLGILLLVNGVAYLVVSLTSLLLPAYEGVVSSAATPALLGEVWIMLWLLIRGANPKASAASAP